MHICFYHWPLLYTRKKYNVECNIYTKEKNIKSRKSFKKVEL